jgi:hypothetical protein
METPTNHNLLFEGLGEVMSKRDLCQDRCNELYNAVIELPMRIASADTGVQPVEVNSFPGSLKRG